MILNGDKSQGYLIRRRNTETEEIKYFKCYGSSGVCCKVNDENKWIRYITFEFTEDINEAAKFTFLTEAKLVKQVVMPQQTYTRELPATPYVYDIVVFEFINNDNIKVLAPIYM